MLKIFLLPELIFLDKESVVHMMICVLTFTSKHFLILLISDVYAIVKITCKDDVAAYLFLKDVLKNTLNRCVTGYAFFLT